MPARRASRSRRRTVPATRARPGGMAHRLTRRGFLAQVAGVATLGGCATTTPPVRARAEPRSMVVDADPSDPARLPAPSATPRPACSDSDSGPSADPAQQGRRCGASPGASAQPRSRFIICPGHPRCPR